MQKELSIVQKIISEIMDIAPTRIQPESYVIRELGVESIDLLEIAIEISSEFAIQVDDPTLFLTQLRTHIASKTPLLSVYPHLSATRISEIQNDLEKGPVLKIEDLLAYIIFTKEKP